MSATTAAAVLAILLPAAFNGPFAAVAAKFDCPDFLGCPTAEVLERFRLGRQGRVLSKMRWVLCLHSAHWSASVRARADWKLAAALTPISYIAWSLWLVAAGVAMLL